MGGSRAEVDRAREALRHLIEVSGLSQREVRKRLVEQDSGADVARLLSGRLDLKLRHILDISRVLDIHPLEFFRLVFSEPEQRSPFLQKLESLIAPGKFAQQPGIRAARAVSPAGDIEELRQRMAKLTREVELLKAAAKSSRAR